MKKWEHRIAVVLGLISLLILFVDAALIRSYFWLIGFFILIWTIIKLFLDKKTKEVSGSGELIDYLKETAGIDVEKEDREMEEEKERIVKDIGVYLGKKYNKDPKEIEEKLRK